MLRGMIHFLLLSIIALFSAPADAGKLRAGNAPAGFAAFHVATVVTGEASHVLILTNAAEDAMVPITINESTALSITLRNQRRRFARPLTHDLLDELVGLLGGEVIEVRIDQLIDGAYTASIDVRHKRRVHTLDARASDAVALALGRNLPVLVSDQGIEATALVQPADEVVIRL